MRCLILEMNEGENEQHKLTAPYMQNFCIIEWLILHAFLSHLHPIGIKQS